MYWKKSLLIFVVSTISRSYRFSLKNKNIMIKYNWNIKCLVLWKFTSWEWMISARNSSNLRHGGWTDWDSDWLILIMTKRLINNLGTYLSVSKPKNWFSIETISFVYSLNRLASKGKGWLSRDTYHLKHLKEKGCFCLMVACLKDLIRYSSLKYSQLWVKLGGTTRET